MQKQVLKSIELITLASFSDKQYFYGVSNPFFGMTSDETKKAYEETKLELDKKGFIKLDFDGTVSVTTVGKEILDNTIYSKVYCFIDGLIDGEQKNRINYYKNDKKEVIFDIDKDENITISEGNIDTFIEDFNKKYLSINNISKSGEKEYKLEIRALSTIKSDMDMQKEVMSVEEIIDFGVKELVSKGLDKEMAMAIIKGILKNCNYVSISTGNTKERNLNTMQLIILNDRIVMIEVDKDDTTISKYKFVDKDFIIKKIKSMINEMEET